MSEFAQNFLLGCIGLAVIIFTILGGLALIMHNGASQTCSQSGGEWRATDEPVTGGVDRVRECIQ